MNQFKAGDVMYHPSYGRLTLVSGRVENDALQVRAKGWISLSMLSYKPWPAPIHERPLVDGFYIAKHINNEHLIIVEVMGDGLLFVEGRETCRKAYELVHYLGTKIPNTL